MNDPDIIVNEFNAYFVNIAKNLADSIPVADHFSTEGTEGLEFKRTMSTSVGFEIIEF